MLLKRYDLPTMSIVYDTHDNKGRRVRGHETRTRALAKAWQRQGGSVFDANQAFLRDRMTDLEQQDWWYGEVLVFDRATRVNFDGIQFHNPRGIVVCISDGVQEYVLGPDVSIDPHVGAELVPENYKGEHKLLGTRYALLREDFANITPTYDQHQISIVPGGNPNDFWDQVESWAIAEYLRERDIAYTVDILQGMETEQFARSLARSGLVITASGVSSIEALAMRKPVMLVRTSVDQVYSYEEMLRKGVAMPYTFEAFTDLIEHPQKQTYLADCTLGMVNVRGADAAVAALIDILVDRGVL